MVILESMGVQRHYVPHLKGLLYGNMEPTAQGHNSTFTIRHAQLKKAILLLKRPKVPSFLGTEAKSQQIWDNFLDFGVQKKLNYYFSD